MEKSSVNFKPVGEKILVDVHNWFNDISCLVILWKVCQRWLYGAYFTFNLYNHWAQMLINCPGIPLVTLLSL